MFRTAPLVLAVSLILCASATAQQRDRPARQPAVCHTKKCSIRVARKHCSQSRPIPCIKRAALQHHVDFGLMLRISKAETHDACPRLPVCPTVINSIGACGLFQILRSSTWLTTPYQRHSCTWGKWNALAAGWLLRRHGTAPWLASHHVWG